MAVQKVSIRPAPSATDKNTLSVALAGIRRMQVFMKPSDDTRRETRDVWWTLSAWAKLQDPLDENNATTKLVNLAPSLLDIAPLGAGLMLIATVFWPPTPAAAALHVKFSTTDDEPEGYTEVYGVGDATPHDFQGLFRAPFGFVPHVPRIVHPLPEDPELLRHLLLMTGQMPPRSLEAAPRRR